MWSAVWYTWELLSYHHTSSCNHLSFPSATSTPPNAHHHTLPNTHHPWGVAWYSREHTTQILSPSVPWQAPLDDTVADFWRMIWEQETRVVVMLTDFVEKGIDKCADYLPPSETLDCHRLYGDFQVSESCLSTPLPNDWCPGAGECMSSVSVLAKLNWHEQTWLIYHFDSNNMNLINLLVAFFPFMVWYIS